MQSRSLFLLDAEALGRGGAADGAAVVASPACDLPASAEEPIVPPVFKLDTVERLLACHDLVRTRRPEARLLVFLDADGYRALSVVWQQGAPALQLVRDSVQCVPFDCSVAAFMLELARQQAEEGCQVTVVTNVVESVVQLRTCRPPVAHLGFMFVDGAMVLPGLPMLPSLLEGRVTPALPRARAAKRGPSVDVVEERGEIDSQQQKPHQELQLNLQQPQQTQELSQPSDDQDRHAQDQKRRRRGKLSTEQLGDDPLQPHEEIDQTQQQQTLRIPRGTPELSRRCHQGVTDQAELMHELPPQLEPQQQAPLVAQPSPLLQSQETQRVEGQQKGQQPRSSTREQKLCRREEHPLLKMRKTSKALYGSLGEDTPAYDCTLQVPDEGMDGETLHDSQLDGEEIQLVESQSSGGVRLRLQPGSSSGEPKVTLPTNGNTVMECAATIAAVDPLYFDTLVDLPVQLLPAQTMPMEAFAQEVAYTDTLLDADVELERFNCQEEGANSQKIAAVAGTPCTEAVWYNAANGGLGSEAMHGNPQRAKQEGDLEDLDPPDDNRKALRQQGEAVDHEVEVQAPMPSVVILDQDLESLEGVALPSSGAAGVDQVVPAVDDSAEPRTGQLGAACEGATEGHSGSNGNGPSSHELATVPACSLLGR